MEQLKVKNVILLSLFLFGWMGCNPPKDLLRTKTELTTFDQPFYGACDHRQPAFSETNQCSEWRGDGYQEDLFSEQCLDDLKGILLNDLCSRENLVGTCILKSKTKTIMHFYYKEGWELESAEEHCIQRGYEPQNMAFTVYWAPEE